LSWSTILEKRESIRRAFDGFNPHKISAYKEGKIKELMGNPGIIRNLLKIKAAISNAKAYLQIKEEHG